MCIKIFLAAMFVKLETISTLSVPPGGHNNKFWYNNIVKYYAE